MAIASVLGAHLTRAGLIVLGFGSMLWFAAESSRTARARLEVDRAQRVLQLDAKRMAPMAYDIHRIHLHELLKHVEDVAQRSAK